jgi:hypothetical protein
VSLFFFFSLTWVSGPEWVSLFDMESEIPYLD